MISQLRNCCFLYLLLMLWSCNSPGEMQELDFDIPDSDFELFIRAFKKEKELELWVKQNEDDDFELFKAYDICKSSGILGPKRREGDLQVPEGFYHIDRFNPKSKYHLSLGINYPNDSDLIRGDAEHPGSDIFIHGKCVTIGCLPMGDRGIEEIYEMAKRSKGLVEVHIFPARMNDDFFASIHASLENQDFWSELKPIFDYFESKHELPEVNIDESGRYIIGNHNRVE